VLLPYVTVSGQVGGSEVGWFSRISKRKEGGKYYDF